MKKWNCDGFIGRSEIWEVRKFTIFSGFGTYFRKKLSGKHFKRNEKIIGAPNFEKLLKDHYKNGRELLEKDWTKLIDVLGDNSGK